MTDTKTGWNWGMLCHLGGLITYFGLPVVVPLFIWLWKRDESPVVAREGREAVNFNISFALYGFLAGLLCYFLIGFALLPLVGIVHVILIVWAVIKSNKGEAVHYPLTLRFIN